MTLTAKPRPGMRVSVAEFLELELPEPDGKRKMELDDGAPAIAVEILSTDRHRSQAAN